MEDFSASLYFFVVGAAALINGVLGVAFGITFSGYKAIYGPRARFWGKVSLAAGAILLLVGLFQKA